MPHTSAWPRSRRAELHSLVAFVAPGYVGRAAGPLDPGFAFVIALAGTLILLLLSVMRHLTKRSRALAVRERQLGKRRRLSEIGARALLVRVAAHRPVTIATQRKNLFITVPGVEVVDEEGNRFALEPKREIRAEGFAVGVDPTTGKPALVRDGTQPFWVLGLVDEEVREETPYRGPGAISAAMLRATFGVYHLAVGTTPPSLEVRLVELPRYRPWYPVVPLALLWLVFWKLERPWPEALGVLAFFGFIFVEPLLWGWAEAVYPEPD